jgi:hypothetical protein
MKLEVRRFTLNNQITALIENEVVSAIMIDPNRFNAKYSVFKGVSNLIIKFESGDCLRLSIDYSNFYVSSEQFEKGIEENGNYYYVSAGIETSCNSTGLITIAEDAFIQEVSTFEADFSSEDDEYLTTNSSAISFMLYHQNTEDITELAFFLDLDKQSNKVKLTTHTAGIKASDLLAIPYYDNSNCIYERE